MNTENRSQIRGEPASQPAPVGSPPSITPPLHPSASSAPASPLPFPQSSGESDRAFEAFRAYLELGPQRRYAAAARKVGASLRTVERWARDFDWRGRVKACAAHGAAQYTETQVAVQRAEALDAAARAKAFRDRQYEVAEAMLAVAARYLQNMTGDDSDQMKFADVCRALVVASRIEQRVHDQAGENPAAAGRSLGDHLTTLLDQVFTTHPASPRAASSASEGEKVVDGRVGYAGNAGTSHEVRNSGSPTPPPVQP